MGSMRLVLPINGASFARDLATTNAIIAKLPAQPWTIWARTCSPASKSTFEQQPLPQKTISIGKWDVMTISVVQLVVFISATSAPTSWMSN